MGCCNSTSNASHDEPPLDAAASPPGRRAASAQQPLPAPGQLVPFPDSAAANANANSSARGRDSNNNAGPTRPNHPIRPPSPLQTSPSHLAPQRPPPWTRSQLDRERDDFFDTRVSGNREVWGGLKIVAEMLRRVPPRTNIGATITTAAATATDGNGEHLDRAGSLSIQQAGARQDDVSADENGEGGEDEEELQALAAAQAVIDALNLTCPNGRVAAGRGRDRVKGGLYDERGMLYELPLWILRDPDDLVEDGKEEKEGLGGSEDDEDEYGEDEEARAAAVRRRQEKGKGRAADVGEIVRLKARLSDRGSDVVVSVGTKQRLAFVVQTVREQTGAKRVSLMYLGKMLDESKTLEEIGWRSGHVVNAFLFEEERPVVDSKKRKKKLGR